MSETDIFLFPGVWCGSLKVGTGMSDKFVMNLKKRSRYWVKQSLPKKAIHQFKGPKEEGVKT